MIKLTLIELAEQYCEKVLYRRNIRTLPMPLHSVFTRKIYRKLVKRFYWLNASTRINRHTGHTKREKLPALF